MFDNFPKTRKPLPSEYQKIYESFYKSNRNGETTASGAAQKMERWLHRKVANDTQGISGYKTLEIGAGTLNQLSYEKDFRHYDIIEPFAALYKDSANLSKIHKIYNDMSEIVDEFHIMNEFADNNSNGGGGLSLYDRIISCAVLEHILDLPTLVANACLLLQDDGVFSASIPSQGRFLWTLGYKATTGLEFRLKYKLNYDVIMNYEHINNQKEIIQICKYFFKNVKKSLFGISDELSLYTHLSCRNADKQKALEFLKHKNRFR